MSISPDKSDYPVWGPGAVAQAARFCARLERSRFATPTERIVLFGSPNNVAFLIWMNALGVGVLVGVVLFCATVLLIDQVSAVLIAGGGGLSFGMAIAGAAGRRAMSAGLALTNTHLLIAPVIFPARSVASVALDEVTDVVFREGVLRITIARGEVLELIHYHGLSEICDEISEREQMRGQRKSG